MSKSILKTIYFKFYKNLFFKYLVILIIINAGLFLFINKFNNVVPLNRIYYYAAVHFYKDPRINGNKFNFLKSTTVYDSQWYLEIARSGYPRLNINLKSLDLHKNDPHKYAFFPFYPLLLTLLNTPVNNLELTAFCFSFFLIIINYYFLYYFVSLIDSKMIAIKTSLLLFLFPLSIFYRFIFTEGLFLLLLLLFTIFLFKKKYYLSAFFLGLSLITRANSLPLIILLFFELYQTNKNLSIGKNLSKYLKLTFIIFLPLSVWSVINFYQTGNFFTFLKVRDISGGINLFLSILAPLLGNLYRILEFPFLSLHAFADSKIEVIFIFLIFYLLIKSKKYLDYRLWWIAFSFWIFPLIATPLISYSRYQIVSFPLFYFLARKLKNWQFKGVSLIFIVGLLALSLYFVNWYWLG